MSQNIARTRFFEERKHIKFSQEEISKSKRCERRRARRMSKKEITQD